MKATGKFHHTSDIYIFNLTSLNYKEGSYYSIRAHYRKYCTVTDSEKWNPCQDIEFLQQQLENPRQKERDSMNCHKTFWALDTHIFATCNQHKMELQNSQKGFYIFPSQNWKLSIPEKISEPQNIFFR